MGSAHIFYICAVIHHVSYIRRRRALNIIIYLYAGTIYTADRIVYYNTDIVYWCRRSQRRLLV